MFLYLLAYRSEHDDTDSRLVIWKEGSDVSTDICQSLGGIKILNVNFGTEHGALLSKDGQLFTFGNNNCGQLGIGSTESKTQPILVETFKGKYM